jgi:hypothetical protein
LAKAQARASKGHMVISPKKVQAKKMAPRQEPLLSGLSKGFFGKIF